MRAWASRLWRSRFSRSVLTLVAGGAAAQAVVFLARPVLTRMYTPEAFGALGEFVALAALLAVLATLRYEDAIPLPTQHDGAGALLALCAAVALGVCGVGAVALLPREAIADRLGAPALIPLLPFVPLAALLYAWGNAAQAWLARADRYRAIALGLGAQALGTVGVQLAAPGLEAAGLVLGSVAGAVLFAAVLLGWALASGALVGVSPEAIVQMARRYARFPRLGLPATALGQVGARLPPLALGAMLGAASVGHFGLAAASVLVPLALVGDSVGQVFGVHAAEAHRSGGLGLLARRTLGRMLGVVAYPIAAVALVGPDLFAFVYGDVWREAGLYARLLAPWLALSVLVPPLTRSFDATERQDREILAGALHAVGVVGGLTVGATLGSAPEAILALGVGGALGRLGQLIVAMRVADATGLWRVCRPPLLRAGACLFPSVLAAALGARWAAIGLAILGGLVCWALELRPSPEAASGDGIRSG